MGKIHNRREIVDHLIQLRLDEIKTLEETHKIFKDSLDIDEDSSVEVDDLVQQSRSTDSAISVKLRIDQAKNELDTFIDLRPELVKGVTEGNVVFTDKINIVIGLAFQQFIFNDEKYVGMSKDAPIYEVLKGKLEGDQFTFNNIDYTISEII